VTIVSDTANAGSPREPGGDDREPSAAGIGGRLAAHRARQGMKVSALARAAGVSPSLISQIERGQTRPSVSTLFTLAEALGVPVDAFFRDRYEPRSDPVGALERSHRHLVRRDERAALDIEGGVRWERLTPARLEDAEFLELSYAPGAESNPSLYRHPGTEMVLVLAGRLDIVVGAERHALEPGDSICFESTTPHRYFNPTGQTTRAVTLILPDGGTEGPPPTDRRRT
jgi:transcriptional regulator with XRE-family HTH domain